jgi:hypothetical protein
MEGRYTDIGGGERYEDMDTPAIDVFYETCA